MTPPEHRLPRLQAALTPLPGSVPRDAYRPLHVPARFDRMTLLDFLDAYHPHYGRDHWSRLIQSGRILGKGQPLSADRIVRGGEQFAQWLSDVVEPAVNPAIRLLHEDDALVLVGKPAPLPMHPCGRFARNTLSELLAPAYAPERLHLVHRLDANTSGLVVLARTRGAAAHLQRQFERHAVRKTYLARVRGHPPWEAEVCEQAIGRGPCDAGARQADDHGHAARTEFRTRRRLGDGTALLEASPISGRTNQIRLHLWHLGFPIQGDPVYLEGGVMGTRQTLDVGDPPLCLHAWRLELTHPLSEQTVRYEDELPAWADVDMKMR